MKIRIKVEDMENKRFKHLFQFTIETKSNEEKLKDRIIKCFESEFMETSLRKYEEEKIKQDCEFIASDLFDKRAVGSDISYLEFLDNERSFYSGYLL
jgi:hypothetical protein